MSGRRLSDRVRVVLAPNPSAMTLDGTNTYLVGDARNVIVIDPGPLDEGHFDAIKTAIDGANVVGVFLTHWHSDHSEGVREFAALVDAPVGSWSPLTDGEIPLHDGERAGADGVFLTAIHTPGHASDHLCFWLEEERALFTGDLILGRGTSVIAHPDGDMRAYLSSLRRVRDVPSRRLYPGHGPLVENPRDWIEEYFDHRMMRERQVIAALPGTPEELVRTIYADVDERLHKFAAMSVRAHLDKLAADGVAVVDGDERWARVEAEP